MDKAIDLIYEWWLQLWPNMFAISVWTTALFIWHHRSLKRHITKETQTMKLKTNARYGKEDATNPESLP